MTHCLLVSRWHDKYLGVVTLDSSQYCRNECHRLVSGILCCTPESPASVGVQFLLFESASGGSQVTLDWDGVHARERITRAQHYERLVVITHGYMERVTARDGSLDPSSWMSGVKDAYLRRGADAVLIVNWESGNGIAYVQSLANVRTIGMMTGRLLTEWGVASRTLMIGFSLGAHIVGEAGQMVQQISGGASKIAECHGLDPAGQFV